MRKNVRPFLESLDEINAKINLRKASIEQELEIVTSAIQRHNNRTDLRSRYKQYSLKLVPDMSQDLDEKTKNSANLFREDSFEEVSPENPD